MSLSTHTSAFVPFSTASLSKRRRTAAPTSYSRTWSASSSKLCFVELLSIITLSRNLNEFCDGPTRRRTYIIFHHGLLPFFPFLTFSSERVFPPVILLKNFVKGAHRDGFCVVSGEKNLMGCCPPCTFVSC